MARKSVGRMYYEYLPRISGSPPPALGQALRQNLAPSELRTDLACDLVAGTSLWGQPPLGKEQARAGSDGCSHPWSQAGEGMECVCALAA